MSVRNERGMVSAGGWCAPSETFYGTRSRERDLWLGLAEPTAEEIATATRDLHERYAEDREAWERTQAFLDVHRAVRYEGLAREVLDLHALEDGGNCRTCYADSEVAWPCTTARIALRSAGVDVPPAVLHARPEPPRPDLDNPRWPFPAGPVDEFAIPQVSVLRGGARYQMWEGV